MLVLSLILIKSTLFLIKPKKVFYFFKSFLQNHISNILIISSLNKKVEKVYVEVIFQIAG